MSNYSVVRASSYLRVTIAASNAAVRQAPQDSRDGVRQRQVCSQPWWTCSVGGATAARMWGKVTPRLLCAREAIERSRSPPQPGSQRGARGRADRELRDGRPGPSSTVRERRLGAASDGDSLTLNALGHHL